MKRDLWIQAGHVALRIAAPFCLTGLLMALLYLPTPRFVLTMGAPAIALCYVYHHAVHQPGLMPYSLAFLAGLLADLWAGGPIGGNALLCFAIAALVVPQERFFRSHTFPTIWAIFILLCFGWLVAQWIFLSFYYWRPLPLGALLLQAILAIALYPPLSRLYAYFGRWITGERS